MTCDQIRGVLAQHGLDEGRMISHSKTRYCQRHRGHFVVFNAQIFTNRGRILQQVDLDLTLDAEKLNQAARIAQQNFFVLWERDPIPCAETRDKPISAVLRDAIWWTRFRPQDADRFLPATSVPLWKRPLRLRCNTGDWRGHPAFSVDFWTNIEWESLRNYSGAAVQLLGRPPARFRPAEKGEAFFAEVAPTSGRPVRPVFYQRTGRLDYVWFSHGAAIPAVLYDQTVRPMEGISFSIHRKNSAIHIRRDGAVIGLLWPCGIAAPKVVDDAHAHLKRLRQGEAEAAQMKPPNSIQPQCE